MSARIMTLVVAALVLIAAAGWFLRETPAAVSLARTLGMLPGGASDTAAALRAAGVHKCVGPHGTSYLDRACPTGTREAAADGGTLTVTAFPKAQATPAMVASSMPGGPLVRPMDPDERDRLRDKAIEDAANRR